MTDLPADLLLDALRLRRRTRSIRSAGWVPVALFGGLGLAAGPLYPVFPIPRGTTFYPRAQVELIATYGGRNTGHPTAIAGIWALGIPAVCLVSVLYQRTRSQRVGVEVRWWPFAAVGVGLDLGVLLGARARLVPGALQRGLLGYAIAALALLALARLERDPALAAVGFGLLGLAVLVNLYNVENVLFRLGWPFTGWPSSLVNALLPAVYLLTAAALLRRAGRA